ncbi:hypothetical protein AMJ86_02030 [bacterium SM23_57]|nr:MAG: hypothetical protein AMJ86_02030 [bacterium SM23_57]
MFKYLLTALITLLVGVTIYLNGLAYPELQLITHINLLLYAGLIFLSLQVISKDTHYRSIFVNLTLFFILNIIQSTAFTFNQIFGDVDFSVQYYVRWVLFMNLAVAFTVVFIVCKYLFVYKKTLSHYLITAAVVVPIWLMSYFPFLADINYLYTTGHPVKDAYMFYQPLFFRSMVVNIVVLVSIGVFFYAKIRHDHAFGYYLDTLMFGFLLLVSFEILHHLSHITNRLLFNLGQYATCMVLIFMGLSLVLRYRFISEHAGAFYESQILSDSPFVDHRPGLFDRFIRWNFFNTKEIKKGIFLEVPKGEYKPKI